MKNYLIFRIFSVKILNKSNTIFECNTNEGKTRIVRIGSIEVVNQTKLFYTLLKYAKEGKYDYHFFYYWILEEWKRFPNFDL